MVCVSFYARLRRIAGVKTVQLPPAVGTTVRDVVMQVVDRYPALRAELLDPQGNIHSHVRIFVGGNEVATLSRGLDTLLRGDEALDVFPAMGGG